MRQILFIHSAGPQGDGEGSDVMLKALRRDLGSDFSIEAPIMPEPDNPEAKPWLEAIGRHIDEMRGPYVIFGHSLGGSLILKYLAEHPIQKDLLGVLSVSAPFWGAKDWSVAEFALSDDAVRHLAEVPRIVLLHGRDDTDVPAAEHLNHYRTALPKAECHLVHGDHTFSDGKVGEIAAALRDLAGN